LGWIENIDDKTNLDSLIDLISLYT